VNEEKSEDGLVMKKEMTIPELKKKLSGLERKELEKMLCDLYKNCDQAEQIMNLQLLDEAYGKKLLGYYQNRMEMIFFPGDIVRYGFSVSMAKKVISDFKKVCQNKKLVLELKLYFAECGTEFTNMYGDIDAKFYDAICSVFHEIVNAVSEDRELFEEWQSRLLGLVKDSRGTGWGFHDYLVEEYYNIPWID